MRHLMIFLLGLVAWACPGLHAGTDYTPPAFADPERLAKIQAVLPKLDRLYRDHAESRHLPGFIYGVMVDGQLIHTLAWGKAQLNPDVPVEADTRFRIASMTKSFTALAILKLRDGGKLSLDDPLERYVPQFQQVKPLTADSPKITLRHLLKMAGGFPQDDPWGDRRLADSVADLERLVAEGLSYSNPPGVRWEYSNLGYALLGQVVTKVAGQPYEKYITHELLQPLGMTNTVWEYDEVPTGKLALGYRWEHERWQPEPVLHDGTFGAMGGLITTLGDFSRYVAMHLNAWPPRDDVERGPVVRATLREMHRPAEVLSVMTDLPVTADGKPNPRVAAYGFGLSWNADSRGVIWVRHAGGLPGYGSEYRFLPDYGVALIAFANHTYAPMTAVNTQAMEVLIETAQLKPRIPVASPMLKRRAEQLSRILQTWPADEVADALASNVFLDKSQEDWREKMRELLATAGEIKEVMPVVPENQLRGRFELVGRRRRLEVFFTLMPENVPKIQEIKVNVVPIKTSP